MYWTGALNLPTQTARVRISALLKFFFLRKVTLRFSSLSMALLRRLEKVDPPDLMRALPPRKLLTNWTVL